MTSSPSADREGSSCRHPHCSGVTRRTFLSDLGMGFTGLALGALLHREGIVRAEEDSAPAGGRPHFPPRAKSIIWLMMRGGVSHLESFDRKPALEQYAGKTIGETPLKSVLESKHLGNVREQVLNNIIDKQKAKIFPTQVGFQRSGRLGIEISDWWPHLRTCADDLVFIRSLWTTDNNHGAQLQFLTGRHLLDGCFPTIGAWIHYGLGALSDDLPQFISMGPPLQSQCFEGLDADYLGPEHAGVILNVDPKNPLPYARPELPLS